MQLLILISKYNTELQVVIDSQEHTIGKVQDVW